MLIYVFFIGVLCIIIGHYEWQKKSKDSKNKVIYKFVDQWDEEKHAMIQEDVYNKYSDMFVDNSVLVFGT